MAKMETNCDYAVQRSKGYGKLEFHVVEIIVNLGHLYQECALPFLGGFICLGVAGRILTIWPILGDQQQQ